MRYQVGSKMVGLCDSCQKLIWGKRSLKRGRCEACHQGSRTRQQHQLEQEGQTNLLELIAEAKASTKIAVH